EGALEDADEQRRLVRVVEGDLVAELGDAGPDLLLADDDVPQGRVLEVVHRVLGGCLGHGGSGGGADVAGIVRHAGPDATGRPTAGPKRGHAGWSGSPAAG